MARAIAPQDRWTIADLEDLPEDNGTRYEIIEGELFMSKQPHWHHQNACANLTLGLGNWSKESGLGKVVPAPGVIFDAENAVAPDLVWVSYERLKALLKEDGKLHGAPELAVEVLSFGAANEHRDRERKRKLYSLRGVNKYWIVDWQVKAVTIYRRQAASLRLAATLHRDDDLTSPLLPGFRMRVGEIFD